MNQEDLLTLKKGQIVELEVQDMAFGGKGISKIETEKGHYVFFIPNTIPGQIVKVRIFKKKKSYAECKLLEVIKRSDEEIEVDFQPISGAPYITLPIDIQKKYKFKTAIDLYKRIGNIENIESLFDEYINSPSVFHYRNKMEYAFSQIEFDLETKEELDDAFALGFKKRGTWWIVENLKKSSGLFDEQFEDNLHKITAYFKSSGLPAWHPPKKHGFFRYFTVRKSYFTNEILLNLTTTSELLDQFDFEGLVSLIKGILGERFAGIIHTINDDLGERAYSSSNEYSIIYGKDKIQERLLGLDFEISMQSFFQTNPKSAERLYTKTIDYVLDDMSYDSNDYVMDLFCGTGTIGQILASKTEVKIVGVDIVEEAIEDAKQNAIRNNVSGLEFYADDVGKFLLNRPEFQNKIKTIVLDPPRGGIAPKTLRKVIKIEAERIVYVSCNPATQARDIEALREEGYELKKISFVDQFPHTAHIEAIALFDKK